MEGSKFLEEILEKIAAEHFDSYFELISFSRVSKLWRSIAVRSQEPRSAAAADDGNALRRRRLCIPGLLVSAKSQPYYFSPIRYHCKAPHLFLPLSTMFKNNGAAAADDDSTAVAKPPLLDQYDESIFHDDDAASARATEGDSGSNSKPSRRLPTPPWWSPDETRKAKRSMYYRGGGGEGEEGLSPAKSDDWVELDKFHCLSAVDGWLVLVIPPELRSKGCELNICLFNPVKGESIPLPPLIRPGNLFYMKGFKRLIVSRSPAHAQDNDCLVIVLFSSAPQLAWCELGSPDWKFTGQDDKIFNNLMDATYFGGKLYIADSFGVRFHLLDDPNLNSSTPIFVSKHYCFASYTEPSPNPGEHYIKTFCHLSELDGELLVVFRHCYESSVEFNLYKFTDAGDLEEVTSLEGHSMFLGYNQSRCIPSCEGMRADCIYFAFGSGAKRHDTFAQRHDCFCGVFSITDRRLELFEPLDHMGKRHYKCHYVWLHLTPTWNDIELANYDDGKEEDDSDCNDDVTGEDVFRMHNRNIFQCLSSTTDEDDSCSEEVS